MSRINPKNGSSAAAADAPPPRWSARAYFVYGFSNDMFNALTACLPLALFWRHLGADVLGVSCFVLCGGGGGPRLASSAGRIDSFGQAGVYAVALQGADPRIGQPSRAPRSYPSSSRR